MTIERKRLVAALAQGARIIAARVMPFPHAHSVETRGVRHDVESSQVQNFVDEKLIVGAPLDALWDRIEFRAASEAGIRFLALQYYPRGFGFCSTCGDLLEPAKRSATAIASRHGFQRGPDKKEIVPACEGSGKPLVDALLPVTSAIHAA